MSPKNILGSNFLKWLVIAMTGLIILLLVFQLGLSVGYRKANFAFRWADNYKRDFGGPRIGMLGFYTGNDFMYGHGVSGTIAKISGNSVIVKTQDNTEKIINVDQDTVLNQAGTYIKLQDLQPDAQIVVIGNPNQDGTIEAKIIRVFLTQK